MSALFVFYCTVSTTYTHAYYFSECHLLTNLVTRATNRARDNSFTALVTINSDKYRNLDSTAPACNSRSAVAPDLLPNVPNDGRGNELSVGVLTASCDQLSSTLDLVLPAGVTCVFCEGMGSLGSTCGDVLTHRLSASM